MDPSSRCLSSEKVKAKTTRTHAALARTNLGLLIHAIQYITENPKIKKIYFEGNINSYTYAEEGASLYDVLNLYNYNHDRIRDPLIRSMKDLTELEDYVDKTGEAQLGMMVEIVKEYENEIYDILRELKEKHVDNDQRDQAEMILTVHRCKGLEYDTVHLVNDFLTDDKSTSLITKQKDAAERKIQMKQLLTWPGSVKKSICFMSPSQGRKPGCIYRRISSPMIFRILIISIGPRVRRKLIKKKNLRTTTILKKAKI